MLDDIKKDANERMNKCVAALKNELKKLRTGRAHTSLLEHIRVTLDAHELPFLSRVVPTPIRSRHFD